MITASEYAQRRNKLVNMIPDTNSIIIVYGREPVKRIPTVPVPISQHSDLVYLSGYQKSGGILAIEKNNSKSTLFLPEPNPEIELWEGKRMKFDIAKKISGVDQVFPDTEFKKWFESRKKSVYCSYPSSQTVNGNYNKLAMYIDQLRVIKSSSELELMRKASTITLSSMSKVERKIKNGVPESLIASYFHHYCIKQGADQLAYPIVAASGQNALCLHYIENSSRLKSGESLLLDAGCEFDGYASDFTRTFPIGTVTEVHKCILELVEKVKNNLSAMAKRGSFSNLLHLHENSELQLKKGLKELGYTFSNQDFRKIYPHGVSHWIGLDVHDTDTIPLSHRLTKGMAFTIEPGLYFDPHINSVPMELRGIGCRFEDTVII